MEQLELKQHACGPRRLNRMPRLTAGVMSVAMALALALPAGGCTDRAAPPPPVDDTAGGRRAPMPAPAEQPRSGLSTGTKIVMLGGAAALYYLYRKHQNSAGAGEEGQYYLSKNGRVYYRDAEHRAHWVTPPPQGISVPESEAREYAPFQGYDNRQTGRDLSGLADDTNP